MTLGMQKGEQVTWATLPGETPILGLEDQEPLHEGLQVKGIASTGARLEDAS